MTTYYQLFGIAENASPQEIKAAYKALAKRHHPDRNQNKKEAEELFKQINAAYQILKNPQKRSLYDQRLAYAKFLKTQGVAYNPTQANYSQTNYRPRTTTTTYHGAYTTFYPKDRFKRRAKQPVTKQETENFFWGKMAFIALFIGGTLFYIGYVEYQKSQNKKQAHENLIERVLATENELATFQSALNNHDIEQAKTLYVRLQQNPYANAHIDQVESDMATAIWERMSDEQRNKQPQQAIFYANLLEELNLRYELPVNDFEYCQLVYECLLEQNRTEEAVRFFTMNTYSDMDLYNAQFIIGSMFLEKQDTAKANFYFTSSADVVVQSLADNYGTDYLVHEELYINPKQVQILTQKAKSDQMLDQHQKAAETLQILLDYDENNVEALELMLRAQRALDNREEAKHIFQKLENVKNQAV